MSPQREGSRDIHIHEYQFEMARCRMQPLSPCDRVKRATETATAPPRAAAASRRSRPAPTMFTALPEMLSPAPAASPPPLSTAAACLLVLP